MIREHGSKDVFYVIDINYFPGNSIVLLVFEPFVMLVLLVSYLFPPAKELNLLLQKISGMIFVVFM